MSEIEMQTVLPELRAELQVKPGIRELDGAKTWLIYDPLKHQYFQIDQKTLRIWECWHLGTAGRVVEQLSEYSVSLDDIESTIRFLWKSSLTVLPPGNDLEFYTKQSEAKKQNPVKRALHGYLFMRMPLVRPHRFLEITEPLSRIFFTRAWWFFIAFSAVVGLFLTSRQWDQFLHTFSHFFSFQGLLYYGIALIFVKCLHELGHGYAATRYGCRVSTMGVALIVLFPVLFTDTTDTWKLNSRKQRMIVSAAGVAVELSLAALATLLWVFLDDGPMRSAAFFIATSSWIMSIAINMNPLMRFDAYHFLTDALGVQNLQARSFALGKWSLREILFGLKEPAPEAMTKSMRRGLTGFAWATWIYRFFLFLGIALLIHAMVFRPFGSILAAVEIAFFIAIPIMNELKEWWLRKARLLTSPASWVTIMLLAGLTMAAFVPWQSTINIPAVVEAKDHSPLYAPAVAKIAQVHVTPGEMVEQGDAIITLDSAELDYKLDAARTRLDSVIALLGRIAADAEDRGQKIILETEQRQLQEEIDGLQTQLAQLKVVAPVAGVVVDLNTDLHAGRWVGEQSMLASVASAAGTRIRGYVSAADLARLDKAETAIFIPDVPEQPRLSGSIDVVDTAHVLHLTIPELTSHYDGPIAVNMVDDQLQPLKAWYDIKVNVHDADAVSQDRISRGVLLAQGEPESLALRFWRRAMHVVLREVLI